MTNINQYCRKIDSFLKEELGINYTIKARVIHDFVTTTPDLIDHFRETYGLSLREIDSIYRIGIGRKINEKDSDIFDQINIDKPLVEEDYGGIICPQGILTFYEDVFYEHGKDVKILAASYHFQTIYQDERHPLYVRFEFDPIIMGNNDFTKKPIFHYHFSNYTSFHKHCHFPAGHFDVPNWYRSDNDEVKKHFQVSEVPNLKTFLRLLLDTGFINRP